MLNIIYRSKAKQDSARVSRKLKIDNKRCFPGEWNSRSVKELVNDLLTG